MPNYHRSKIEGGTYFFTVISYHRIPILTNEDAREILHMAWKNTMERYPFTIDAVCLLPDHLHCIWTLPTGDSNYSVRWSEIKRVFAQDYVKRFGQDKIGLEPCTERQEANLWQRRFWEHAIRDDQDLNAHLDYIHFNPVKHGLVKSVSDWPWSSFHQFVKKGFYDPEWGRDAGEKTKFMKCGE